MNLWSFMEKIRYSFDLQEINDFVEVIVKKGFLVKSLKGEEVVGYIIYGTDSSRRNYDVGIISLEEMHAGLTLYNANNLEHQRELEGLIESVENRLNRL